MLHNTALMDSIKTAHQYKIRLKKSKEENLPFDHRKCDLSKTKIKKIDRQTAKKVIVEYEWLGTIPQITRYCFGLYFIVDDKEYLGGVVIYSDDYAQNTGVWDKYGFEDKLILLSRGVCLWWTPKNTASYFISKTYDWLRSNTKYRIITATVDPAAGEIGTIYQSLNWHYVGLMSGNYNSNKETKRFSVLINGKLRYSRSIRKEFGTMKRDIILKKYPDAVFITQYRKRRYFYFIGNKYENKKYLEGIKHLIMPYPKRGSDHSGIIYKITNLVNNKIYIGQTTRPFKDRIKDYERFYGNDYINNSFKKYGFDNFKFEIIDTANNIEELNKKEIYYINKYNSTNKEIGYNIEFGGLNSIPNDETRKRMSESHMGIKQTDRWIKKRIAIKGSEDAKKYGREKSEEEKKRLSETSPKYWEGKERSEDTKRKISETKKERGLSKKQKDLLCKRVVAYNPMTENILGVYESSTEAAKHYPLSQSTISRRCTGKSKNNGDVHFKYQ
jgi:group I intron endonuclease